MEESRTHCQWPDQPLLCRLLASNAFMGLRSVRQLRESRNLWMRTITTSWELAEIWNKLLSDFVKKYQKNCLLVCSFYPDACFLFSFMNFVNKHIHIPLPQRFIIIWCKFKWAVQFRDKYYTYIIINHTVQANLFNAWNASCLHSVWITGILDLNNQRRQNPRGRKGIAFWEGTRAHKHRRHTTSINSHNARNRKLNKHACKVEELLTFVNRRHKSTKQHNCSRGQPNKEPQQDESMQETSDHQTLWKAAKKN